MRLEIIWWWVTSGRGVNYILHGMVNEVDGLRVRIPLWWSIGVIYRTPGLTSNKVDVRVGYVMTSERFEIEVAGFTKLDGHLLNIEAEHEPRDARYSKVCALCSKRTGILSRAIVLSTRVFFSFSLSLYTTSMQTRSSDVSDAFIWFRS